MAIKYKPNKEIYVLGRQALWEDYELSKQHYRADSKLESLEVLYKTTWSLLF